MKKKLLFSKMFAAIIAIILFAYSIYAGLAYYHQVIMYYDTVKIAIQQGTEYMSITLPDPSLAVTCVTCILASFLTYCLYLFGCKNSLNSNSLYINTDGLVERIADNFEDDSKLKSAG